MDKFDRIIMLQNLAIERTKDFESHGADRRDVGHPMVRAAYDSYERVVEALLEDFPELPEHKTVNEQMCDGTLDACDTLDRAGLGQLVATNMVTVAVIRALLQRFRLPLNGINVRNWLDFVRAFKPALQDSIRVAA
jgi:hypothetical protein